MFDEVSARPADTLALTMDGEGAGELALDDSNLVIKAVLALAAATGREPHARLHLRKQIPLAGGLAGGSADAAAALVACDALWGTGFSREELAQIGAGLGSDVPFLVLGGTALGTGRGEAVSPVLAPGHAWHWVVAIAEGGLSTPEVYRELDRLRASRIRAAVGRARRTRSWPRCASATRACWPRRSAMTCSLPRCRCARRCGRRSTPGEAAGVLAGLVSGSGPTCVFLTRDAAHATAVATALADRALCRSVRTGARSGARRPPHLTSGLRLRSVAAPPRTVERRRYNATPSAAGILVMAGRLSGGGGW